MVVEEAKVALKTCELKLRNCKEYANHQEVNAHNDLVNAIKLSDCEA